MIFGSVSSGIEAASVAWGPLGWKAAWFSEIEPYPNAVLAHHYPDVPNLGDMSNLPGWILAGLIPAPDLLCGGTPCQAFSMAGARRSLDDARGNLSLIFCDIANAIDTQRSIPAIIVWENVPGVLSTKDNAFGCFLAGLAGEDGPLEPPGQRWANAGVVYGPQRTVAWRILDAQYFGLAQRRKRVFVVASARKDFDPVAVLFEFEGLRRDSAPSRKTGEDVAATLRAGASSGGPGHGARSGDSRDELIVAGTLEARTSGGGFPGTDGACANHVVAVTLDANHGQGGAEVAVGFSPTLTCVREAPIVSHSLRGEGFDASEDGTGRGIPLVSFHWNARPAQMNFNEHSAAVSYAHVVRRLTPEECEALQGFPREYTLIPYRGKPANACPDGPRYKALGNSWAIPPVRWIGERIQAQLT